MIAATFDKILGNEQNKVYLTRMVEKNAIANSLLFAGPDGIGKSLFALAFAKFIIGSSRSHSTDDHRIDEGNHPDVHIYRPEGKIGMHSIHTMRQFSEDVYLAPFEAKRKVFIIHDADRMLPYSANALLKTFEEPSKDSVIILLSDSPESLLPTVLSRCRVLRFLPLSEQDVFSILQGKIEMDPQKLKQVAALSKGSPGYAFRLAEQGGEILRKSVLGIFASGKMKSYHDLSAAASEIAELVETSKKQEADLIKEELLKIPVKDLTASQLANIEKEVDGAVAMRLARHAQGLFEVILSWYRDLQLLLFKGNPSYLINRDWEEELNQALKRGEVISLEEVEQATAAANLALERSTPLNLCMESLLLRLNIL